MLATLHTPYADTRADALSFALGLPRLDALAVLHAKPEGAGPEVELRLLGASHQVLVGTFSETVACLPGEHEPVPGRYRANAGGWAYDFASATVAHDGDAEFRRAADALRELLWGCSAGRTRSRTASRSPRARRSTATRSPWPSAPRTRRSSSPGRSRCPAVPTCVSS